MLVLSRKIGQQLVIGDGIVVVVKRIAGQRVTFGIEAPQDVRIVRGELKPLGNNRLNPTETTDQPTLCAPAPIESTTVCQSCAQKPR